MKRWNGATKQEEEIPAADAFLEEVIAVCRRHGFSIGHEDGHGAFLVQDIEGSEHNFAWLREAHFEATAPAEHGRMRVLQPGTGAVLYDSDDFTKARQRFEQVAARATAGDSAAIDELADVTAALQRAAGRP